MSRLGQQTWFSIAAVWLAISLSVYWAHDIDVSPSDLRQPAESENEAVVRHAHDLDAIVSQPQFLNSPKHKPVLQPAGGPLHRESDSKRSMPGVVRLPDTYGTSQVELARYQRPSLSVPVSPVWLDGRIELSP